MEFLRILEYIFRVLSSLNTGSWFNQHFISFLPSRQILVDAEEQIVSLWYMFIAVCNGNCHGHDASITKNVETNSAL